MMNESDLTNGPGILNDVIGPIMRGPSSSHTAASWRIARICLDVLKEPAKNAVVEFDQDGAWAKNYKEQGTAMGINGGLLGLDMTDPRMEDTLQVLEESELTIIYKISSFRTVHVNTVRITLEGIHGSVLKVMAASLGGGQIKIYWVNGFDVDIRGDYFELLIIHNKSKPIADKIKTILPRQMKCIESVDRNESLINVKSSKKFPVGIVEQISLLSEVSKVMMVHPVLPVISGNGTEVPFTTIESLLIYAEREKLTLGEIGLIYEQCGSGLPSEVLLRKMKNIVRIIEDSIKTGLAGTHYKDRILHRQSQLIGMAEQNGKIPRDSIMNGIISNVTAIMEVKSSMGVFVANPTAGSCGTIGGLLKAIADEVGSTEDELIKAYFAAGMVGVYFAAGPGFSAEEHGCQVECGAASGMAASAIVQLFGGTARQAIDAASMAIQNMIGLICDPVADRVEVPCLGKNVSAAVNAYASAAMVCSGFDAVIPLHEVLETVSKVSRDMPACVKCTGTGGLAITKTALGLKDQLTQGNQ